MVNCTNLYAYKKVGSKGKTKRVAIRPDWLEAQKHDIVLGHYMDEFKPCTGKLSVKLNVTQGCCCHDASELEVTWTCTECGDLDFAPKTCGEKYDFEDFVNTLLETVTEFPYKDVLTLEYEKRDRRNARITDLVQKGMTASAAHDKALREEFEAARKNPYRLPS